MSVLIYTEGTDGDLTSIAEIEDIDSPVLAIDALLDEVGDDLEERDFVCVVGSLDSGTVVRVSVTDDAPVNPKRTMEVSGGTDDLADEDDEEEEAPKPAPKKRGRPPAKKKAPAAAKKAPAKKKQPAAKKAPAKAKKSGSPFRRNEASDE